MKPIRWMLGVALLALAGPVTAQDPAPAQDPQDVQQRLEELEQTPQGYFYYGPFGVLFEYVRSSQDVIRGAAADTLDNDAWQVAGR